MLPVLEALADPTRQRILALLLAGERPVGELVDELGVAQPSVSKHLAKLKAVGLVAQRAEAQKRHYRLTPEPLQALKGWLQPYLGEDPFGDTVQLTSRSFGPQGWTIAFEAFVAASPDAGWDLLTTTEGLETWLGKGTVDSSEGRIRLQFAGLPLVMNGAILAWAPPRRLECRLKINPKDEGQTTGVAFDLLEEGQRVRFCVTHKGLPSALAAPVAAAWHAHLERLSARSTGQALASTTKRCEDLRAGYLKIFASS